MPRVISLRPGQSPPQVTIAAVVFGGSKNSLSRRPASSKLPCALASTWFRSSLGIIPLPGQRAQGLQGPVIQFSAGPESALLLEIAYGSDGVWTGLTVNFTTIKSPPRQLILYCLHDALLYLAGCSGIQRSSVHHPIIRCFGARLILARWRVIPRINVFFVAV